MPESAAFSNITPAARTVTARTLFCACVLAALVICYVPGTRAQQMVGPQPATDTAGRSMTQAQSDGGKMVEGRTGEVKTGGVVMVRKRRTSAKSNATPTKPGGGAATKETTTAKDGQTKDAPVAKDVKARKETDASDVAKDAADETAAGVVAESSGAGDVETELAALRAKLKDAKPGAERARLQRAYIERLIGLNRKAEAVAELRAMVDEERFDPPYFYNAGNSLARLGESGAAVEAYRKAIAQRHGNYARAQHNLGVVLVRLGRWDEAQEALTAALRQENFTYAEASYNLGRLHALRGEAGLAINEWTRTLKLQPDHAHAATALASALAEDGDPKAALAVLDAFSARANKNGTSLPREIAVTRGEIVAAANISAAEEVDKHGAGERVVRSLSIAAPSAASKSERSSASSYRESRPSSAPLRSLAVDRQSYDLLQRARTARESGRAEDAATLYRRVIQNRGGYFPPANLELGYALGALNRFDEAVAALLPITRRDAAHYPIAFYHLGRYYEHLGQLNLAGDSFARAASLYGETNPQFLLDVSRVREKEGKAPEALAAMEEYVRISGQQGSVPEWTRERVAKLREKTSAAKTTPVK